VFNVLISGDKTAWETDQLMRMETSRFKEYSEGSEAKAISLNQPETLEVLESVPALLMYERGIKGTNDTARFGRLTDVKVRKKELVFLFEEEGRVPMNVVQQFAGRIGISEFEQNRTHWAIKDGGIPSALLERLQSVSPIISTATRNAFEDSYTQHGVLRDIAQDFGDAGVEPDERAPGDSLVGQRRTLLRRYYASINWHYSQDTARVLKAYSSHLKRLDERGMEDEVTRLTRHLKRDRERHPLLPIFDSIIRELTLASTNRTSSIENVASLIANSFDQAYEHFDQALEHLRNAQSQRSRKDGLRDCLSAMESLLKTATGKNDIKDATAALKANKRWGNDAIVKDGLSIWNRIHELHPDVRHGQATSSDLPETECTYWVDRISAFVRYIARMADEVLSK
jgi:hypothetical protein